MTSSVITQVTKLPSPNFVDGDSVYAPADSLKENLVKHVDTDQPSLFRRILRILCCQKKSDPFDQYEVSPDIELPFTREDGCLLPPKLDKYQNKKCLVIDLDETLVHSTFNPIADPDFVVPVDVEGVIHKVYVKIRPFVDQFLEGVQGNYECILFTASLDKYADPVADFLDSNRNIFETRLFRDACVQYRGNFVKDLARLGRNLKDIIILDNSPVSYLFHPDNALPIRSWFDDPSDNELLRALTSLNELAHVEDVRLSLGKYSYQ